MDAKKLWDAALEKINKKISIPSFETWFKDTTIEIDNDVIIVKSKNQFASDWLESRYKALIFETVCEIASQSYDIKFSYFEQESICENHPIENDKMINRKLKEILERMMKEDFYSDDLAIRLLDVPKEEIVRMKNEVEEERRLALLQTNTAHKVKRELLKNLLRIEHSFSDKELMDISMLNENELKDVKNEMIEEQKKEMC